MHQVGEQTTSLMLFCVSDHAVAALDRVKAKATTQLLVLSVLDRGVLCVAAGAIELNAGCLDAWVNLEEPRLESAQLVEVTLEALVVGATQASAQAFGSTTHQVKDAASLRQGAAGGLLLGWV
jgi:hypothetical protein